MKSASDILNSLTIDEKIRILSGVGSWRTYDCNKKLPQIMMSDGPHGLRKQEVEAYTDINKSEIATCFPTESALSCSWDTKVIAKLANAVASEALKEKISVVLGCGVNIKRNPLCGRNFEYFSEDPYLSGELGVSYINAMQQKGVGTSLKHFACNNQEKRRQTQNSIVDERTMHEIYLSAFEKIVKCANPTTIMASYNRINGVYSCHNPLLLNDILRKKWGYDGLVVSDWGAAVDIVQCIKNGLNLEMPDTNGFHTRQLKLAYENGSLTQQEINSAAIKVIELILSSAQKLQDYEVDYKKQNDIAASIAAECLVLLKNDDDILPLNTSANILLVGEMAQNVRFQGSGSSHITVSNVKTHIQCMGEVFKNSSFALGYKDDIINESLENQAIEKAKNAQYVVFFGGLTEKYEGEGFDRENLNIPQNQESLLYKISQVNSNIIFVAAAGSAFVIKNISKVKALLLSHLGGQAVATAVAKAICGAHNPSGKLTETYPLSVEDVPSTKWFAKNTNNVHYAEGLFVGYRYFDTYNVPVLYDFGFGLSYTNFEYSNLKVLTHTLDENGVTLTFSVKNTGAHAGAEITQIYVKNNDNTLYRAQRELAGFAKTHLDINEEKTVTIQLSPRSFSAYSTQTNKFELIGGCYELQVSAALNDVKLTGTINVNSTCDKQAVLGEINSDIAKMCAINLHTLKSFNNKNFDDIKKGDYTLFNTFEDLSKTSLIIKLLAFVLRKAAVKMSSNKDKDSPEAKMIVKGLMECTLDCVITQSNGVLSVSKMQGVVLWANGHPIKALKKIFF